MMRHRFIILAVSLCLASALCASAAEPKQTRAEKKEPLNVLLTVEERANVARDSQPVTAGVPLPKGLATDTSRLRVVDREGNDVSAQFTVLNRWHPTKSIKWVQVDFQASVPAGDTRYFCLRDDGAGTTKGEGIEVRKDEGKTIVDTGAAQFEFADGKTLFTSAGLGSPRMEMTGSGAKVFPAESKHSIELSGPLHTVVKLEGGYGTYLNHVTRVHLYRGASYVRIVHTIENLRGGSEEDLSSATPVAGCLLTATPPFSDDKGLSYRFGTDGVDLSGVFERGKPYISLTQDSSDHYEWQIIKGEKGEGRGKSVDPPNLGFVDVNDGKIGVSAGIKHFWQMWPRGLSASEVVGVYLMTRAKISLVPGMSRTHEVLLFSHKADLPAEEVRAVWMFLQKPLFAACPTEWYCQKTMAFGRIVDGNLKSYKQEYRLLIKRYDDFVARSIDAIQKTKSMFLTADSYGMIHFGDVVRGVAPAGRTKDGSAPKKGAVRWNNNAEDYPHLLAIQFARTAELKYLDLLVEHGRHMADVCTYRKFPGNSNLDGTSRPWGALEHFRDGEGEDGEIQSTHYGFYQVEGMLDMYYLTGDLRARDMGRRAASRVRRTRYSGVREIPLDETTNYAVSIDIGNAMQGAAAGYRESGVQDFITVADEVLNRNRNRASEWQFADAHGGDVEIHAVAELFELTGKANYREILLSCAKAAWEDRKQAVTPPMARMWSVAAEEVKEPKYIERIIDSLNQHTRLAPATQPYRFARGAAMLPQAFWSLKR